MYKRYSVLLRHFEGRKNWTIEIIRQWAIKEFNIHMSHRGMAGVL